MFTLQEPLEKAQLLAIIGDQHIQSHHYAADSIRPKCAELRHLCADCSNANKRKYDLLGKSLELHRQLDKVSETAVSVMWATFSVQQSRSHSTSLPHKTAGG